MTILKILVGLGILALGRQLFWLFVGGLGFVLGLTLAQQLLGNQFSGVVLIIALLVGIAGAMLALFLQRLAVTLSGFIAGGLVMVSLLRLLEVEMGWTTWLLFVIGGIIGAVLVMALFDWTLIGLSVFLGAALIVEPLQLAPLPTIILFVILFIVGTVIQAKMMLSESSRSSRR